MSSSETASWSVCSERCGPTVKESDNQSVGVTRWKLGFREKGRQVDWMEKRKGSKMQEPRLKGHALILNVA
jgi:hypothetical protein